MVELLLLRHGIAEPRCGELADADRALTERGRQRTRAVAQALVRLGLAGSQLVSSPLRRARETAAIACEVGLLAPGCPEFSIDAELAPGGEPSDLVAAFRQAQLPGALQRLVLVGHEPDLGNLAAQLIGAQPGAIALKKAGVALLQLGPPSVRLTLLMAPRQILANGGAAAV